ncbi:DUF2326 domain-containing protein [Pseudomonas sp. ZB1P45]|uniref:DUF2326 domain-containing protein n=1 Tax=Pseudomonas frigoris TaxID=3398356 RepID=UPI0039EE3BC3
MQLINFKVIKSGNVIRDINFKDGINIITNDGHDGNQIGKSTSLRAINFCLGSDGESLWKDPDNNNINDSVREFLIGGEVLFKLSIFVGGQQRVITRKFEQVQQKSRVVIRRLSWIDDSEYKSQDGFKLALATLFGHTTLTPSFNTIKNKFLRISRATSNNSLRYLTNWTTNDEYTLIYSYLFGFVGLEKLAAEIALKQEIESLEFRKESLLNGSDERDCRDRVAALDLEIELLLQKEGSYDLSGIQEEALARLRRSREAIASLSTEIANLEARLVYVNLTVEKYEASISDIDSSVVEAIYNEANIILPSLARSLEETIAFHNSIFSRKALYVRGQRLALEGDIFEKKTVLEKSLALEKNLIKDLSHEGHFSGFILLERDIQQKVEERGKFSYLAETTKSITAEIRVKKTSLDKLKAEIEDLLNDFNKKLTAFNECYGQITLELFSTYKNILKADTNSDGELSFSIINENKNTGDGVPRAAAMAFDMALVDFLNKSGARFIHFNIQDYLESADEDKLVSLIKLANDRGIQTVIAILNDKLSLLSDGFKKDNIVLKLSSVDKFFSF